MRKKRARLLRARPHNRMLVVSRDDFDLKLFKRPFGSYKFEKVAQYEVAVGAQGFATPRGVYLVNSRAKYPEWLMPDSDWVPRELRGTVVPGGAPENPLKERWLGVTDPKQGVGIHGTADVASIGRRASHGCIRMRPEEIVELYPEVPKYTPIVIL